MGGSTAMIFMGNTLSLIAILPGTALFVFLGASGGKITETSQSMKGGAGGNGILTIISVVIGIFFAVLGIVAISFYARRELNKFQRRSTETVDNRSIENSDDTISNDDYVVSS